jgi:coniferyl-aldehyde dehydrogenase
MKPVDNDINALATDHVVIDSMIAAFGRQRASFVRDGPPSEVVRRDRIDRVIGLLVDHQHGLCAALDEDFSGRAHEQSRLLDVYAALEQLKYCRRHLRAWMRPERRRANFPGNLLGARAEVHYQPKGVVANICPWNFPVHAGFGPLAAMLAAGNRVIIKLSEFTPRTAELCQRLVAKTFDETEVAVFFGGPTVGEALIELPFDHIFFTGSPRVGKLVMAAAAKNLTPVTLELGGKSPAIVAEDADFALAAYRIAWAKLQNSGQICVTADYAMLPEGRVRAFVDEFKRAVAKLYSTLRDNPDYTAMITDAHRQRVLGYLDEARGRGAEVIEVNPANEDFSDQRSRKIVPALVIDPPDDCRIMQEEIFGPVLPIKTYRTLDHAVAYVNARPRPLALYYFGARTGADRVLASTISGGAAVNDLAVQVLEENLPFGGSGNSGMGNYHAEFGFKTFSHAKAVYWGTRADPLAVLRPPYGRWTRKTLDLLIRR